MHLDELLIYFHQGHITNVKFQEMISNHREIYLNQISREHINYILYQMSTQNAIAALRALLRNQPLLISTLFSFNNQNESIYYQYIAYELASEDIGQELAFALEWLPLESLKKIHFPFNAAHELPVMTLYHQKNYRALELCFTAMRQAGRLNPDFQKEMVKRLTFSTLPNSSICFLNAVFLGHDIKMMSLWLYALGEHIFYGVLNLSQLIEALISRGNHIELERCFLAIENAISKGYLPSDICERILLTQTQTLLNKSFSCHAGETSHVVLDFAFKAYQSQWISKEQYAAFLFDSPLQDLGVTYLHQVLLSSSYQNVYRYINDCLRAVEMNIVDLNKLRDKLIEYNRCGFSIIHQAVNNPFLENAELILNLAQKLFEPEKYQQMINAYSIKTNNFTKKKQPRCSNDKENYKEINQILTRERKRLKAAAPIISEYFYYNMPGRQIDKLETLMHALLNLIRKEDVHLAHAITLRENLQPMARNRLAFFNAITGENKTEQAFTNNRNLGRGNMG